MSTSSLLLEKFGSERDFGVNIVYRKEIPPVPPDGADLPQELHPALRRYLESKGIRRLYRHQARAFAAVVQGEDTLVTTPTASGKTLCYTLPLLQTMMNDPEATALLLFPLKALARDQLNSFREATSALIPDALVETFDGDVSPHVRKKIIGSDPRVIFTNPDMLHASLLPGHEKWETFFKRLTMVVIDETHTYRGVFGSHVAQVIRRLLRVCRYYGSSPQFVASSATIDKPGVFAEKLLGRTVTVISDSGAPRPGGSFLFYNPTGSPYTDASKALRMAVGAGLKTIVFTKARKITELIYTWTLQAAPELAGRIGNYRAGFLPEERREVERLLFSGEMDGVVTTSALEMGVDIGGLDVCILVGYPGAVTTTWQRAGRVGRGERAFVLLLIAGPDALDQHFMRHPEDFFSRGFEEATLDPENETILKEHIVCAAAEMPLPDDDDYFRPCERSSLMAQLRDEKRLVRSVESGDWLSQRDRPHRFVSIRSAGESYTIFGADGETVIGTLSGAKVFAEAHEGAVYLHRGRQYRVERLDCDTRTVRVKPMEERYYTRPRTEKETEILAEVESQQLNGFRLVYGRLKVESQVVGYEKRAIFGQESLGVFDLAMPKTVFETYGYWVEIPVSLTEEMESAGYGFRGAIHAVEHAAIALFPLFALCDRDDIGGVSYPHYPRLGCSAIFFYDGYPGGVGLCKAVYEKVEKMWRASRALVEECDCGNGCPSCVHSPKCGNGNKPLDKEGALYLLRRLAGEVSFVSPPVTYRSLPPKEKKPTIERVREKRKESVGVKENDGYNPAPDKRILFFDLETQKGADEVGGWGNIHLMRLAVAVVYDSIERKYLRYWEKDAEALIAKLLSADLVVGFNHIRFDYGVLAPYTKRDLKNETKNFDIMLDVWDKLGHRLGLAAIGEATLGRSKTADGLQSLIWWDDGKYDQVADYCEADVELTKSVFEYGLEKSELIYTHKKSGQKVAIRLDWELGGILEKAASEAKPCKPPIRF